MALGKSPADIVASGDYPLLEISPRWERVRLGEIATVQNGAPFSSEYFTHGEGMPLIRIRDVRRDSTENFYSGPYEDEFVVRKGDILIGMDGDFHAAIWKGPDGLLNQRVCRLTLTTKLYFREFLFLALQPYLNAINAETSSVTVKHLSSRTIADIPLPLPPLAEQKRIVAKIEELFSELEAGEESLRAARRQLGVYRQSLLKQAFEGKLTEKWRAENPDKLESPAPLLARIQAARQAYYEQQLKDWGCAIKVWSEVGQKGNRPRKPSEPMTLPSREFEGDITRPDCWAIDQIGNCPTDALIGLVRSADEQTAGPSGFSYIKMDRVDMQGNVDISPSVFVDCTPEEVERFALKKGDILFNTRNSVELVGKVGIVRREPNSPTVYNNNLMRIRLPGCFDPVFVGLQLCAQPFRQRMDRIKKATTSVAAVYAKDFWPLPLAICSLPEQQEIVRLLDEQFEAIERNEREIDAALKRSEALRQAILKKAFTGQLVPQDPVDEPASTLLARIRAESAAAAPSSKVRRTRSA